MAASCKAQLIALILSDVIGDDLDVIASGPTVADGYTLSHSHSHFLSLSLSLSLTLSLSLQNELFVALLFRFVSR